MEIDELREQARRRNGDHCEWSHCGAYGEQLAHLHHRGMGGSELANRLNNVMWLCQMHHDLLDGRQHAGLRRELAYCLQQIIDYRQYIGLLLRGKGDADEGSSV